MPPSKHRAAPAAGRAATAPRLTIEGLTKRFGRTEALRSVCLELQRGRVYGLAGENGAGKSTLIRILGGVHRPDEGKIELEGQAYAPDSPAKAEAAGLSVFHQEIPICPNLSVATNVFLGPRLSDRRLLHDRRALESRCRTLCRDLLDIDLDPRQRMGDCSAAERQLALLARVLSRSARLIILDEPTTALTPPEVGRLFAIINRLKAKGITFLFVSHLLEELTELCDEIHVLRDGLLVGKLERGRFGLRELSRTIAGRTVQKPQTSSAAHGTALRLEVKSLSRTGAFRGVTFQLRPGEILGLTGLQGSGRTAVARALFGAPPAETGQIRLDGQPLRVREPAQAIRAGIGYVPEDRQELGLLLNLDIQRNLGLAKLGSLGSYGLLQRGRLRTLTETMRERLGIRMEHAGAPITSLSGGNQQKVLISRWLAIEPRLLVMNEPTRGVDVGAKSEIRELIVQLARQGCAFVIASSELDELLGLADRFLVLTRGEVGAEFARGHATKEDLILAAAETGTDPRTSS